MSTAVTLANGKGQYLAFNIFSDGSAVTQTGRKIADFGALFLHLCDPIFNLGWCIVTQIDIQCTDEHAEPEPYGVPVIITADEYRHDWLDMMESLIDNYNRG